MHTSDIGWDGEEKTSAARERGRRREEVPLSFAPPHSPSPNELKFHCPPLPLPSSFGPPG